MSTGLRSLNFRYAQPTSIRSYLNPDRVYFVGEPNALPELPRNLTTTDIQRSAGGRQVRTGVIENSELPVFSITYANSGNPDLLALAQGRQYGEVSAPDTQTWTFNVPADGTAALAPDATYFGFGSAADTVLSIYVETPNSQILELTQVAAAGSPAAGQYTVGADLLVTFNAAQAGCQAIVYQTTTNLRTRSTATEVGLVSVRQPVLLDDGTEYVIVIPKAYVSSANAFTAAEIVLDFAPISDDRCSNGILYLYGPKVLGGCQVV